MEPITIYDLEDALDELDGDAFRIHDWQVEQLCRLGMPRGLAVTYAGRIDWHDVASLVERGCTPELALEIVR